MPLPPPEFEEGEVWDGTTPRSRPNTDVFKRADGEIGNRHSSEIIALEELLNDVVDEIDLLRNPGPANSLLGVKGDQSGLEYKNAPDSWDWPDPIGANMLFRSTGIGTVGWELKPFFYNSEAPTDDDQVFISDGAVSASWVTAGNDQVLASNPSGNLAFENKSFGYKIPSPTIQHQVYQSTGNGTAAWAESFIFLTENLIIYVTTSGNDTTGNGSVGNPFATTGRAWTEAKKYYHNGYLITIDIGEGHFTENKIYVSHPFGSNMVTRGQVEHISDINIISINTSLTATAIANLKYYEIKLILPVGKSISVGDYIIIEGGSSAPYNGTKPRLVVGCHKVIAWNGGTREVTLEVVIRDKTSAAFPNGNEIQTVGIDDATTGGHFHLTYDGQTTGEIAWNANAGTVDAALEALSNIDAGDVSVTGGPGPTTDWVVEFTGNLACQPISAMTGDGSALTGGSTDVTITETVPGGILCQLILMKTVLQFDDDAAIQVMDFCNAGQWQGLVLDGTDAACNYGIYITGLAYIEFYYTNPVAIVAMMEGYSIRGHGICNAPWCYISKILGYGIRCASSLVHLYNGAIRGTGSCAIICSEMGGVYAYGTEIISCGPNALKVADSAWVNLIGYTIHGEYTGVRNCYSLALYAFSRATINSDNAVVVDCPTEKSPATNPGNDGAWIIR